MPWVPNTELEAIQKELAELTEYVEVVEGEVCKVYDEITGGRFSKPNTAAVYVIEAAEKYAGQEAAEYRALVRALVTSSLRLTDVPR